VPSSVPISDRRYYKSALGDVRTCAKVFACFMRVTRALGPLVGHIWSIKSSILSFRRGSVRSKDIYNEVNEAFRYDHPKVAFPILRSSPHRPFTPPQSASTFPNTRISPLCHSHTTCVPASPEARPSRHTDLLIDLKTHRSRRDVDIFSCILFPCRRPRSSNRRAQN
jgi:hypothetical protein